MNDKGAWTALNYCSRFDKFWDFEDNVERIHAKDVSCEDFIERFEKLNKPVVIEGIQVNMIHSHDTKIYNFAIFLKIVNHDIL